MTTTWRRAIRLPALLAILLVFAGWCYWRFLCSPAFRLVIERLLAVSLAANVSIGAHELDGPSRMVLRDLRIELLAGGEPSGVRLSAAEARASSRRVLGVGVFDEIALKKAEITLPAGAAVLSRLDVLALPMSGSATEKMVLEDVAVSFLVGEKACRVPGITLEAGFADDRRLSMSVMALVVEGLDIPALVAEAPRVEVGLEFDGPAVRVTTLRVDGRSGWHAADRDIRVDMGGKVPAVSGQIQVWGLSAASFYTPEEGVELSAETRVEGTLAFEGPLDDLSVIPSYTIKGPSYSDRQTSLLVEGFAFNKLRKTRRVNLLEHASSMVGAGGQHADSEVPQ